MANFRKRKEIHVVMAIAIRVTDESVKLDDLDHPRVLKTLRVVFEGGSLDGATANFPTRDVSRFVVGVHPGRNRHFFETYKRTISIDIGSLRTIFRCAGLTFQPNNSSWWKGLLAALRIRKLKAIVI
ncbi:MAG TPA: hypothetical protein VJ281_03470 [Chthoniobacterales bacterium]|jgi:hypothetical protein|nr:hypothetical protein [Chthoniobacterales bacterium]